MGQFLRDEIAADRSYVPPGPDVLAAFARPFDEVRVPHRRAGPYPTVGHAMGLSFSVRPEVSPIPRSLANIFRELTTDLLIPAPTSGDFRPWADQGVLLLNRVLTVEPGFPGSHRGRAGNKSQRRRSPHCLNAITHWWRFFGGAMRPLLPVSLGDTPVISSAHPESIVCKPWVLRVATIQ